MSDNQLPLKTLFVLPSLSAGGAERVLITFMNGADRDIYAPVFLSVSQESALKDLIDPSIPCYAIGRVSVFRSLWPLYKTIKDIKPDIVISTMAHMNFALLLLKPFFPQIKFIVREAITPSYFYGKYKMRGGLIRGLYRFLYPKADMVLSPTQKVFDEFAELSMAGEHYAVIRNPVDVAKMRNAPLDGDGFGSRSDTVRFLCCGRLEYQKGFDRLIKKMADFTMPYDWHLDIVGGGPEHKNLQNLIAQNGLQDKITLQGFQKEPYKFFARADCFLLPSRFEGLPNVVLESLACGTPVIATKESGGIDEIAKDAAAADLKIAEHMDGFMAAMRDVKPQGKTGFAASLLPPIYAKERVIKDFYKLVQKAARTS